MFTKNLGTGSNPESETIKGRAAPIPFYGALPQAVKIDDLNRRAGGDELTSLMADADVITGDDYNENDGAPVWRDVPFAVLFLIHFCLMLWLGIFVAPAGYKNINFDLTAVEDEIRNQSDNDISEQDIQMMEVFAEELSDYLQVYPVRIVCYLVVPCLLISFFFAHFMLSAIIKPHTKPFVYSSLVGSIVGTAVVMISMAVMSHSILVYIVTGLSLLGVFNYVQLAWKMVLFAAVNLKVSLTGISTNWGMYLISFVFAGLGFLWNIYWVYVLVGVSLEKKTDCLENNSDAGVENATCSPPMFVIFGLLLSLYWTSTIIMNIIQVTVSGVMATWCFVSDEAHDCFSPAVYLSLIRSVTYSFGSICMGSLLQAIVSVLRYIIKSSRRNAAEQRDACEGLCFSILDCLAGLLEDIVQYFNQWAYCFVGIYGLSYVESGRQVVELFRARGWTSIVTDNLVGYTMAYAAFLVGIATGLMGLVVDRAASSRYHDADSDAPSSSYIVGPVPGAKWWTFGISFLVGLWVASVIMSVVMGAVNALIVCWADSPAKLEYQHPVLTAEMAQAWNSVFPEANIQIRPPLEAKVF